MQLHGAKFLVAFASRRLRHGLPDLRPQLVDAAQAPCTGKHDVHVAILAKLLADVLGREVGQLPCADVNLCDDNCVADAAALCTSQQVDELLVRWEQLFVPCVTEVKDMFECLSAPQVCVDQLGPGPGDLGLHVRMAQAWGVHHHEVGQTRPFAIDLIEVQPTCPCPGLRAGSHLHQGAEQCVDDGRLPRVGAADEHHLRSLPRPVRGHLRVLLCPLQGCVLLGGAPAQEMDGHVVPGDAKLVHDLAGAEGLGHQAGAAVPADQLVEGLCQHEEAPVRRDCKDVVLDLQHLLHLHGNLCTVGCQQLRHVLRSGLQVEAPGFEDALDLAGSGGYELGPPTLPLEPRQVHGGLQRAGLGQGVRHIAQRLIAAGCLAVWARRQLGRLLESFELD
mmetsp:Transcript_20154/g.55559  ORF Transcript_20154/g.55559 Transcript_20154/m.55559 type:complete len:391 (+) Transcript_20154:572-1744(+)